jgi:hypothetical protein
LTERLGASAALPDSPRSLGILREKVIFLTHSLEVARIPESLAFFLVLARRFLTHVTTVQLDLVSWPG